MTSTLDAIKLLKDKMRICRDAIRARLTAYAGLKSAVEERDKIKERQKNTEGWWRNAQAYGMRMERSRNALKGPLAQMKARAEKAEAEVMARKNIMTDDFLEITRLKADLLAAQAVNARNGAVIVEQMVDLERARPLLEALNNTHPEDIARNLTATSNYCSRIVAEANGYVNKHYDAALAYKEAKEKP